MLMFGMPAEIRKQDHNMHPASRWAEAYIKILHINTCIKITTMT